MIKKIKTGFRLMKHQYNFKSCICFSLIMLVMGGYFYLDMYSITNALYGAYIIDIGGALIFLEITSIFCTELFQSSPKRKFLETKGYVLVGGIGVFLGHTVCMGIKFAEVLYWENKTPSGMAEHLRVIKNQILLAGVIAMMSMIYLGCVRKYYFISFIGIMILLLASIGISYFNLLAFVEEWSLVALFIVAYLLLFLGGFIGYFLSCLLYKKKMSVFAQPANLRKYLK